jgi:hypothetical protein
VRPVDVGGRDVVAGKELAAQILPRAHRLAQQGPQAGNDVRALLGEVADLMRIGLQVVQLDRQIAPQRHDQFPRSAPDRPPWRTVENDVRKQRHRLGPSSARQGGHEVLSPPERRIGRTVRDPESRQQGRKQVGGLDRIFDHARLPSRNRDQTGHVEQLFVMRVAMVRIGVVAQPLLLVEPAVELLAMIADHGEDGRVVQPLRFQGGEEAAQLMVGKGDLGVVERADPGEIRHRRQRILRSSIDAATERTGVTGLQSPGHGFAPSFRRFVRVVRIEQVEIEEKPPVFDPPQLFDRAVDQVLGISLPRRPGFAKAKRHHFVGGVEVEPLMQAELGIQVDVLVNAGGVKTFASEPLGERRESFGEPPRRFLAEAAPGAVGLRLQTGHQRCHARQRPRGGRVQLGKSHRALGQGIEVRGHATTAAVGAQLVGPKRIDHHQHEVSPPGALLRHQNRISPTRDAAGQRPAAKLGARFENQAAALRQREIEPQRFPPLELRPASQHSPFP